MSLKFRDLFNGHPTRVSGVTTEDAPFSIKRIYHEGREIARMQEGYVHGAIVVLDDGYAAQRLLRANGIRGDIELTPTPDTGRKVAIYSVKNRAMGLKFQRREPGTDEFSYLTYSLRVDQERITPYY